MNAVRASEAGLPASRWTALKSSPRLQYLACLLLFCGCTLATVQGCASMSAMGGMPMAGGWTLSMVWMRMPGQTWFDVVASFLGMWLVMMVAMMLPLLMPMLSRIRDWSPTEVPAQAARQALLMAAGYFLVWCAIGALILPVGLLLAAAEMSLPALACNIPLAAGVLIVLAGAMQFTVWKRRQLDCCRNDQGHHALLPRASAWYSGLQFGIACSRCCANLMTVLLVVDVMDLSLMALVTLAISAERLAPASERVAQAIGVMVAGYGLLLIIRAVAAFIGE
jgi:predicted metal-binding membrane protein